MSDPVPIHVDVTVTPPASAEVTAAIAAPEPTEVTVGTGTIYMIGTGGGSGTARHIVGRALDGDVDLADWEDDGRAGVIAGIDMVIDGTLYTGGTVTGGTAAVNTWNGSSWSETIIAAGDTVDIVTGPTEAGLFGAFTSDMSDFGSFPNTPGLILWSPPTFIRPGFESADGESTGLYGVIGGQGPVVLPEAASLPSTPAGYFVSAFMGDITLTTSGDLLFDLSNDSVDSYVIEHNGVAFVVCYLGVWRVFMLGGASTPSGGATVTVDTDPPTPAAEGALWIRDPDVRLFVHVDNTWVEPAPVGGSTADSAVMETSASGATDLDLGARAHHVTMTGDTTFTWTAPSATGTESSFTLWLDGVYSPTFPASVKWPGGVEPTYTSPALYLFSTIDGGTTWYGSQAGAGYA